MHNLISTKCLIGFLGNYSRKWGYAKVLYISQYVWVFFRNFIKITNVKKVDLFVCKKISLGGAKSVQNFKSYFRKTKNGPFS